MATATLEIVILLDSDGNYAVGVDRESAAAAYANDFGNELAEMEGHRYIYATINATLPAAINVKATVPDDWASATLAAK